MSYGLLSLKDLLSCLVSCMCKFTLCESQSTLTVLNNHRLIYLFSCVLAISKNEDARLSQEKRGSAFVLDIFQYKRGSAFVLDPRLYQPLGKTRMLVCPRKNADPHLYWIFSSTNADPRLSQDKRGCSFVLGRSRFLLDARLSCDIYMYITNM